MIPKAYTVYAMPASRRVTLHRDGCRAWGKTITARFDNWQLPRLHTGLSLAKAWQVADEERKTLGARTVNACGRCLPEPRPAPAKV
ncbi:MAG: hypothetical protein A2790_20090 [Phenylobacterium sp. RIFCSPHIGHO2_01_FULL_69_31]|uniref:hypothetical protein n=1 Tax=Phenylobacterium sp. RIFCSPHIGHO2_01_FULL_69_31 TaxID=1801944 RepID=UPI0008D439FB|nr:hypothetical protein [Phenylobacterium sp. RIFCSPHIGHO2_01_FULL_69_31]OHB26269.1 MAG: hypothetical protein A2790_20090 [Phenylobacterium sp. RIFCSPHIGHO2_01_FULL_69_31]